MSNTTTKAKIVAALGGPKIAFGIGVGCIAMGVMNVLAGNLVLGMFLIVLGAVL